MRSKTRCESDQRTSARSEENWRESGIWASEYRYGGIRRRDRKSSATRRGAWIRQFMDRRTRALAGETANTVHSDTRRIVAGSLQVLPGSARHADLPRGADEKDLPPSQRAQYSVLQPCPAGAKTEHDRSIVWRATSRSVWPGL